MRSTLLSALVPFILASGCSNSVDPPKDTPKSIPKVQFHKEHSLEAKIRLDEIHCYCPTISSEYRALLDTISWAEGADYNTLYGHETFADLSRHPNVKVTKGRYTSTAAGRYQIKHSTAEMLHRNNLLTTMEPDEQDRAAIYLFEKRGVNQRLIENAIFSGNFSSVWNKLAPEWASFPSNRHRKGRYGQAQYSPRELENKFFQFYAREREDPCRKNIY